MYFLPKSTKQIMGVDMHISRISRENEKWFCETFLARNAAARNCGKNGPILANFEPNFSKK